MIRRALLACTLAGMLPLAAAAQVAPLEGTRALAAVRSSCGTQPAKDRLGMLRGVVRDGTGTVVPAAAVSARWHDATHETTVAVLSDSSGAWHLCGIPFASDFYLRAASDEGIADTTGALDPAHAVGTEDLEVLPKSDQRNSVRLQAASALLVVSLADRAGHPLAGVNVEVQPENGVGRTVVTDSGGNVIVAGMPAGRARVRTRAIGYRPGELLIPLDLGRNTLPLMLDAAHIPVLATVRVIGDREILARHQEFEMRRMAHEATASFTADDIAKRNPVDTWQMLTNVPAMRISEYGSGVPGVYAYSARGAHVAINRATGNFNTVPCWYHLVIDGIPVHDTMPDLSILLPKPSEIHGLEVFAGLASLPPQYNTSVPDGLGGSSSNACGLILVWTK